MGLRRDFFRILDRALDGGLRLWELVTVRFEELRGVGGKEKTKREKERDRGEK